MSIAELKKITIMGQLRRKTEVLARLQDLGCLHLISLNPEKNQSLRQENDRSDNAHVALRFLQETTFKRKQVTRQEQFDVVNFVDKVMVIKDAIRLANDRRDYLRNRIKLFEPWGDIYFPPKADLSGYRLWFYVVPHNKLISLKNIDLPWQIVSKNNRFAYVVVISKKEPESTLLPIERSHLGSKPLSELRLMLEDVEVELESLTAHRQELTSHLYLLSLNINGALNQSQLKAAHSYSFDENEIFVLQGWVDTSSLNAVEQDLTALDCAVVIESPRQDEHPPTLLEHSEDMSASKDLAMFYQVPDYRSWDPSHMLVLSFSLFFAMILADAGYGMLLCAGLLLSKKRLSKSANGKAYFKLGVLLCFTTLIYGMLVGSYFGLSPSDDLFLARFKVLDLNDFDTMMSLSIGIGVAHIVFANLAAALANPSHNQRISRLGWCSLIICGFLFWKLDANPVTTKFLSIWAGLALLGIFFFSSEQTGSGWLSWLIRIKDGLLNLANIMTLFGDILSYMRLFALGLASASLAVTFNQLAVDAYHNTPGVGLLVAILIVLIGHLLNLALSLISGVVHGLRLNYIEFYKWGLPIEGKAFERFAKKEIKP